MPGKSFSISSRFEAERGKIAAPKASLESRKIMSLFRGKKCAFESSTGPLAPINVPAMSNSPATRDDNTDPPFCPSTANPDDRKDTVARTAAGVTSRNRAAAFNEVQSSVRVTCSRPLRAQKDVTASETCPTYDLIPPSAAPTATNRHPSASQAARSQTPSP